MGIDLGGFVDDVISGVSSRVSGAIEGVKDSVKGYIDALEKKIKGNIESVQSAVKGFIADTQDAIFSRVAQAEQFIEDTLGDIGDKIGAKITEFKDAIEKVVEDTLKAITQNIETIADRITDTLADVTDKVGGWIEEAVSRSAEFVTDVGNKIKSGISDLADGIKDTIGNLTKSVGDWVGNAVNSARDLIANVTEKVGALIRQGWDYVGGVLDRVKDFITNALNELRKKLEELLAEINKRLQTLGDLLEDRVITPISDWWADVEKTTTDALNALGDGIINPILANPEVPAGIKKVLGGTGLMSGLAQMLFMIFAMPTLIGQTIDALYAGPFEKVRQGSYAAAGSGLLTPGQLTEATERGLISPGYAAGELSRYGYVGADIQTMRDLYKRYLGIGDEISLVYRGIVSVDQFKADVAAQGFGPDRADLLLRAAEYLPNVPDLIRMAVREAFSPEIAERFGQYEDFPPAFAEHGAKLGLSEEWAQRYWAAHWDLPSPYQGFEMLHRGIIDEDDLKLLMRALDIMPFWRDRLIQMSYNPLTRVDVRRMHKLKILDRDQVKRAYLDLGYNDQHAEWLTDFTEALNKAEVKAEALPDRELTKSEITRAYQDRMIEREDSSALLQAIGYDADEGDFILTLIDWRLAADERDRRVAIVKKRYVAGVIAIQDVWAELSTLNLTAAEMQNIQDELELQTIREPKLPSLADITAWLKKGIIEDYDYVIRLIKMGYQEADARHYLQAVKPASPFVEGYLGRV